MAVRTSKIVFYQIPKTGSVWVKEAIRRSGLPYDRCKRLKTPHEFGLKRSHDTPDGIYPSEREGLFSFCFVRHPVQWYRSFWCFRKKTDYFDYKFPADRLWSDDYEEFVNNVLDKYPDGFLTQLYQYYTRANCNKMDFIGKQERLADDLVRALTMANEVFDEGKLRAMKYINVAGQGKKFRNMAIPSDELVTRIENVEHWVIEEFYA